MEIELPLSPLVAKKSRTGLKAASFRIVRRLLSNLIEAPLEKFTAKIQIFVELKSFFKIS